MQNFFQLFVAGLAIGAVYALIALGFVVIYRASKVFNFAHGELAMFGAFLMITLTGMGFPWLAALAAVMVATGLLGSTIERAILRPLVGKSVFVTIILTIFIGLVLRTGVIVFWGVGERAMPTPWDTRGSIEIFGAIVPYNAIATLVAAALALAAFYVLFQRSRLGVAMRATATDQEASLALGIPVGSVFTRVWFIAGAMAALAGVFLGMFPRVVDANLGFVALRAFPAILIGGLTSPLGAIVGGLTLGVLEVLAQGYVNPHLGTFGQNLHTVVAYLAMILVLMVRPYGLFGARDVERV
jgi:branched-chain amino acid transport system permease protein